MAFLAEIKRRRVGKVAIAYGAVAWAVTEAASVVLPALYVPEWAMTFLVVFLLVGFPIAMVLAWVFDVSATGIERTEPLAGAPPQMQFRRRYCYCCCSKEPRSGHSSIPTSPARAQRQTAATRAFATPTSSTGATTFFLCP